LKEFTVAQLPEALAFKWGGGGGESGGWNHAYFVVCVHLSSRFQELHLIPNFFCSFVQWRDCCMSAMLKGKWWRQVLVYIFTVI